jgi:KaiC/GvpD/RAD55 family RecA-like ATPase
VAENTLPEALLTAIAARGDKQSELAQFLQRNESSVSLYIAGKQVPSLRDRRLVQKLGQYLKVPAEEVQRLIENQRRTMVVPRPGASPRIRITTMDVLRQAVTHLGLQSRLARFRSDPAAQQDVMLEQGYIVNKELFAKLGLVDTAMKDTRGESLTRLLEPGLRLANEAAVFNDYLRRFGRDRWIRTAVCQVCAELNRAFDRARTEELPAAKVLDATTCALREVLVSESNSPLGAEKGRAAQQHARALLLALCQIRYLEATVDGDGYRRRWRLYANFLINKLLGIPLHIDGLDYLLDGGLLLPSVGGLPVLIEGEAGSGKTTLALQIAASLASHGFVVIYLAAEERLESLVDRLLFMGFRPGPSSHGEFMFSRSLWPLSESDAPDQRDLHRPRGERLRFHFSTSIAKHSAREIEKSLDSGQPGWILLSVIPNRKEFWDEESSFLRSVSGLLSELGSREAALRCLVVDSLDSVGMVAEDRLSEEKAFRFVREHAEVSLLVTGKAAGGTASNRHHLCDLHFRLENRVRTNDFDQRTIEVVKSRAQSHVRGRHQMAIHGDRGVAVYPSVQAFLSVNRRRIRSHDDLRPFQWDAPGISLDEMLAKDVVAGDSILLAGPPATHKFPLALSFLAAGVREVPEQPVMLISLRQDEPTVLRIIHEYPQFQGLVEAHKRGNLRVIYEPPDYFTAERFLHWIRREFRQSPKRFSRVVFSTLNQLAYNSPMFKEEMLFVAALIELFRSNGATSLFLSVNRKQDEIENIFDAILFTEHEARATGSRVLLSVGHSGPCNAARTHCVLERQTTPAKKGRLTLRSVQEAAREEG